MPKNKKIFRLLALAGIIFLFSPSYLWATQAHGGSEGIVAHQLGHLFFMVSTGMFVYWLGRGRILSYPGWRYIMLFALFLVVWNLDVVLMHFLDEQLDVVRMVKTDPWMVRIETENGSSILALIYYLGKMDHLLCVPALFFLFKGLKHILSTLDKGKERA